MLFSAVLGAGLLFAVAERRYWSDAAPVTNERAMEPINPKEIRYIKLGAGGRWEKRALDRGEIHFGMPGKPAKFMEKKGWKRVANHFQKLDYAKGMSAYIAREHREFEELGSDCLWITFSRGFL